MLRRPPSPVRAVVGLAMVLLIVAACGDRVPPRTAAPPSATPIASMAQPGNGVTIEVVADQLGSPVDVTTAGDGSGRIFVVEQGGTIQTVKDGDALAAPFLDISDRISSGGERGLLGLAFHPDFPADPRFFVDYTNPDGDTVIASFRVDPAHPDRADATSELILLTIKQPFSNHNGGSVAFGNDGMLYIGMGDGGSGGDPQGNGQRLDTLLGKILRIDVLGPDTVTTAGAYAIPADNPYADRTDALPEIWLSGVRNPWRIRFDEETGSLWIGDVGQTAWEEVDAITPDLGGANLGWNTMEGTHCFATDPCDESGLTLPVAEYDHGRGCSITGGVVVRSAAVPAIQDRYLFSDYCSGTLWSLDAASTSLTEPTVILESDLAVSALALDEDGSVLLTDLGGGELLRLVSAP